MKNITRLRKGYGLPINIQFFAKDGEDDEDKDGDDDQDDSDEDDSEDDEDEESEEEKQFTQTELDDIISKRLAKEKKKWARKNTQKNDKPDNSDKDKKPDETAVKLKELEDRAEKAEAKTICLEQDVDKDCVDDVVALAKAYIDDDTDLEDAVEKVIKKYPQFKKSANAADDEEEDEEDKKPKVVVKSTKSKKKGKKMSLADAMKYVNEHPDTDLKTLI